MQVHIPHTYHELCTTWNSYDKYKNDDIKFNNVQPVFIKYFGLKCHAVCNELKNHRNSGMR